MRGGDDMAAMTNYIALVERVNERCREIHRRWAVHIACRKGCDACCRHIGLFPVEAAAVRMALEDAPPEVRTRIRKQAREATADGPCPLLDAGACLLYKARPIICRTHGLPVLTFSGETAAIDFCPRNFTDVSELPGDAALHLDRLNAALAAVNGVFAGSLAVPVPGRVLLAQALLRPLDDLFGPGAGPP